jgi:60 kDa SS-A/Ro ribonucleoprotein
MARINVRPAFTHEGAPAVSDLTPEEQLRRSLLACLLWEDQFYVDGKSIAERISELANKVEPLVLHRLAIETRQAHNLRHAPLMLLEALSRRAPTVLISTMRDGAIQRVDEMGESLAIIFEMQRKRGQNRRKVPHGWIKGIRAVLPKFNEYQLAKYRGDSDAIKLRDVLRIARPKPKDEAQSALWKRVVKRELAIPDTWEVELSAGKDKRETFERLIRENRLGYLALLRNLRNMIEAGVDEQLVAQAIIARKGGAERVLPFRFIAAARAAPKFEPYLDQALCETISELPVLPGKTIILVDVSQSMDARLSARSDMTRMDAAAALAAIISGTLQVFTFSNQTVEVPPRRGMAGVDVILRSQQRGGTYLGNAVKHANGLPHDRLIVVTDEQSHDPVPRPSAECAYLINVASYQNGVGYRDGWVHIDGFSESVLRYIHAIEGRHIDGATTD